MVYCNGLLLLRIVFCRLVYLPPRFGRWGRRLNLSNNFTTSLPPFLPSHLPSLPPRRLDSYSGTYPSTHTSTIHKTTHPSTPSPSFSKCWGTFIHKDHNRPISLKKKKRPGIYCDTMIIILPLSHLRTPPSLSPPPLPSSSGSGPMIHFSWCGKQPINPLLVLHICQFVACCIIAEEIG